MTNRTPDVLSTYANRTPRTPDMLSAYANRTPRTPDMLSVYANSTNRTPDMLSVYADSTTETPTMLSTYTDSTNQLQDMTKSFKTYTFDECYVPVKYHTLIDEEKDLLAQIPAEAIPVPEVDNSILHAVLTVYVTRHRAKTPREVARVMKLDARELSGAIHMLTGMSHEDFLRQYRLRAIKELLTGTSLSVQTIATHFGYSSIHALNRFLSDQTGGLSANMIRKGCQKETN